MPTSDDRSAEFALGTGKVTPDQIADARELVAKMAGLGVKRDLLGALVDREALTRDEADRLRAEAAAADPDGPADAPAESPSAPADLPAAEEAELVEEAALVTETTVPGATEPAPPAGATPVEEAELVEEAVAVVEPMAPRAAEASPPVVPPAAGAKQVASVENSQAQCHRHPGRAAMRECEACGKPLCSECVVRTPDGIFCGEACFLGFGPPGSGGPAGTAAALERKRRRTWPLVAVVVLVPAVIVAAVYLRPSESLKKARRLKTMVADLEAKGRTKDALKAALELASMPPEGGRTKELIAWGGKRSKALKRRIGLAAVGRLRKSLATLATGDPAALSGKRRELAALAARFSDVGEVTAAIAKIRSDVDARLAAARKPAKASRRRAVAERRSSLADLSAEVEVLLKARRFAEAGRAVEKARRNAGERPPRHVIAGLFELDGKIASAIREAHLAEGREPPAVVSAEEPEEARPVRREVIDGIGAEDVARAAGEDLKSVDAAAPSATQRADLQKADKAVAKARQLMASFDYELARVVLKIARLGLETEAARADVELWTDIARREHAVLRKIVRMISAKPLDLEALKIGGSKGTKGVIFEADEKVYSVRVKFKVGGTSVLISPWGRLTTDQMCRLAKLAVGDEREDLVGLALFCGGRGGARQAKRAIDLLRRPGDKDAEALTKRYAVRLSQPAQAEAPEGTPREGTSARASGEGGKEASKPSASAGEPPPTEGQKKKAREERTPRVVDVPCPCCRGAGAIKEIGCSTCECDGYNGILNCADCDGEGRREHQCPACRGKSAVTHGSRTSRCARCLCPMCKGRGKVKRPNPKAARTPTGVCVGCSGGGYEQHEKCVWCVGTGFTTATTRPGYYINITCWVCKGDKVCAPICRKCNGKGYRGPSGPLRRIALCIRCAGTGHLFELCTTCGGRGWNPVR